MKPQVSVGEALRFEPTEIGVLADSMRSYVRSCVMRSISDLGCSKTKNQPNVAVRDDADRHTPTRAAIAATREVGPFRGEREWPRG